jgi:hypothetical protein
MSARLGRCGALVTLLAGALAAGCERHAPTNVHPPTVSVGATAASGAQDVRIEVRRDAATGTTTRRIGARAVADDTELHDTLVQMQAAQLLATGADVIITIDVTRDVPWADVIGVLDACNHVTPRKVEFDIHDG